LRKGTHYYNAARRDPAETQEIMAKAGTAQVDYEAQNKKVGNDTVRGAAVEAEMQKLRAEAAAAKATADALTQQINGLTQAQGQKRAELEKLANEARTAKAEADTQTALLYQQRQAELTRTEAEARIKTAESTAAESNAAADRAVNDLILEGAKGNTGYGAEFASRMRAAADRRAGLIPSRPAPQQPAPRQEATAYPYNARIAAASGFFRPHLKPAATRVF
jgi:chromosome segregation ATPase